MAARDVLSNSRVRLCALLAVVAALCAPKFGNAFVWDDIAMIVESDRLFDLANLPRVFTADTMFISDGGKFQRKAEVDTYRPVTISTFFVDAWISGRNPVGYHLDNLAAHLICVALVYAWSQRLLGRERSLAALAAAAFFGLHPLLAEAHIWINGRSDAYATLFGLAGALLWLRPARESLADSADEAAALDAPPRTAAWPRSFASGALFSLALLSKETAAPFMLALLLWEAGFFTRPLRELRATSRAALHALPVLAPLLAYAVLRVQVLSGARVSAGGAQAWLALERLPLLLLDGLSSVLLPDRIMPRYLHEEYSRLPSSVVLGSVVVVSALAVIVLRERARAPVLAFGLVNFVAVVAPVSLIATMAWYGFGRYLYLPVAVLAPGLVDAGSRLLRRLRAHGFRRYARVGIALFGLCLAKFAIQLSSSLPAWDGPVAFYSSIIVESPEASHGHGGLGKCLVERGDFEHGLRELKAAVELSPFDSRYLNNLGMAYLRSGQRAKARETALLGLQRFPKHEKFARLLELVEADAGLSRASPLRDPFVP